MSNDTVNLLAMVLILIASGCIKYSPSEQSSEAQQTIAEVPTKRNSNKKSVQQLLESFRGGTIDLREKTNFTISGTFNEEKLLKTNITIRGNGTLILVQRLFQNTERVYWFERPIFWRTEVKKRAIYIFSFWPEMEL